MRRTVIITTQLRQAIGHYTSDHLLVIPNHRSIRQFPGPVLTHCSITDLANSLLRRFKLNVATSLTSFHALVDAAKTLGYSDPEGTARCSAQTITRLFRAGANFALMEKEGSPRSRKLATLAIAYLSILEEKGYIDEGISLWRALEGVYETRKLFLYGYTRLEPNELSFIDKLAGEESIIVLPGGSHAIFSETRRLTSELQHLGWIKQELTPADPHPGERTASRFLDNTQPASAATAWVFPTAEDEVRGILAEIKRLIDVGVSDNEIVIVAENEKEYHPLLSHVAWEYGMSIRILYAIPIVEMRLGVWLMLLCDCLENDFPYETTLRLFKHTLGGHLRLSTEQFTTIRKQHPHGLAAWANLVPEIALIVMSEQADTKTYQQELESIFTHFNLRKRCARWAAEITAYHKLIQELRFASMGSLETTKESYLDDLREALRIITSPAQPGRTGVELHNPHSLIGSSYGHVFVLGAAETVLPPIIRNDTILDFHERVDLTRIGIVLASPAIEAQRKKLEFWSLLGITKERITLCYPQLLDNSAMLPSPYIAELGITPVLPPKHPPASPEEWYQQTLLSKHPDNDELLNSACHAHTVEEARELSPHQDEFDGVIGIPYNFRQNRFSASQLAMLGRCPFLWFCNKLLHLALPDEMEDDLSPIAKGELYHKTLELLLSAAKDKDCSTENLLSLLEGSLNQASSFNPYPIPDWEQRRPELLNTLRWAISAEKFLAPGTTVLALEQTSSNAVELGGFLLRYRVDRLDRTIDGLEIVDYKTGSHISTLVKNNEGKLALDIQLPIYAQLLSGSLVTDGEQVTRGRFYSINEADNLQKKYNYEADKFDQQILTDFFLNMQSLLEHGRFPVQPDLKQEVCTNCQYDLVCRRGPRLGIKENQNAV